MSPSGQNAVRLHLDGIFERPKGFWTLMLNQACQMVRQAHTETADRDIAVEMMEPNEDMRIVRLCGSYILEGGGTILFAPPGRGKSYTAMIMAVCVDAGCDLIWPVRQRRVLYVNLERSRDSMRFRLACINRALGLGPNRPLPFLNARGRSLADVYTRLLRAVAKNKTEVVFLDSISRAGMGDLTENQTGNTTIDLLNRLCGTWVGLGHTPRADDKHVFGSVHFDAGMDVGVQLLSQAQDNVTGFGLQITKANDIAIPPMSIIAMEWGEHGLKGVRLARGGEFVEIEAGKPTSLEAQIEEYLLLGGDATGGEIAAAIGRNRSNVSKLLASSAKFVRTRREGKKVYYGVRGATDD